MISRMRKLRPAVDSRGPALLCLAVWLVAGLLGCRPPEDASPYRLTHDLLAELPQGDLITEIRGLAFGTVESHPFLLSGFSDDHFEQRMERPYAWGIGATSELSLPVLRRRDAELVLELRPLPFDGAPPQGIEISLNETPLGRLELEPYLATYRLPMPAEAQILGDNTLRFEYDWHRRPNEVGGAATDRRELAVAFFTLRWSLPSPSVDVKPQVDADRGHLFLPQGLRLELYLDLTGRDRLRAEEWSFRGDSSHLRISLQTEGGQPQMVADLQSAPPGNTIELPGDGPRIVRLRIESLAMDPTAGPLDPEQGVVLTRPRIESEAPISPPVTAAVESAPATTAGGQGSAQPPHLIITMIDTLRADHLGTYGYGRPTSPHFDALAAESLLFERAIAQSSWTRASVASVFTGLWPLAHGTNLRDHVLPDDAVTLAELLQQRGYRTAAFLANANVSELFGFSQGFDHVEDLTQWEIDGPEINAHVRRWLEQQEDGVPLFLYIHTIDPHSPYDPPSPYRETFAPQVATDIAWTPERLPQAVRRRHREATAQQMAEMIDLYDAEIAYADAALGELRRLLEERDLFDKGLWVVLSDHGEEFLEHGNLEHGKNLFGESLHVPLLIKPVGRSGGDFEAQRIAVPTQHIDLLPTLARQLDLPPDPTWQGRDLTPLWRRGEELADGKIYSYLHLDGAPRVSLVYGDWKIIQLADDSLAEPHLYHLAEDPGEQRDVARQYPVRRGYLLKLLRQRLSSPEGRLEAATAEIDDRLRQRLQALGYLQ